MRRIRYFIKLESEEDQIRVDFETDRGYVMALKNYLKTKSRLVFDTKVKNKPVGAEPDNFPISSQSALKYLCTSTAKPESFLPPSAVTDAFFSPLI